MLLLYSSIAMLLSAIKSQYQNELYLYLSHRARIFSNKKNFFAQFFLDEGSTYSFLSYWLYYAFSFSKLCTKLTIWREKKNFFFGYIIFALSITYWLWDFTQVIFPQNTTTTISACPNEYFFKRKHIYDT